MLHVAVGPGLRRDDGTGDERLSIETRSGSTLEFSRDEVYRSTVCTGTVMGFGLDSSIIEYFSNR